jgi:hypothetical protein
MPMVNFADSGGWMPDRANISTPGVPIAFNACPTPDGYKTIQDTASFGLENLAAECRGAKRLRTQDGQDVLLAGTQTKLYRDAGAVFEDVTRVSGGDYNLDPDNRWSFDVYGNRLLATNKADAVQRMESPATDFSLLNADCSRAGVLTVFDEFVVLGNIIGQGANASAIETQEGGLHWCAIGNPESWPVVGTQAAIDVQSDFQILEGDGGPIYDIVPAADYACILRERQVWRMDYVGAPSFFAFRKRDDNRGAVVPGTGIAVGNNVYFLSEEGFLVFNGSGTTSIGYKRVDQYVRDTVNWTRALSRSSVVHDENTRSIIWLLPVGELGSLVIAYNYELDWWWNINKSLEWLFHFSSVGFGGDLDEVLAPPAYGAKDMDILTPPDLGDVNLDTLGAGGSGRAILAAFSAVAHSPVTFSSSSTLTAVVTTSDFEIPGQRRASVRYIRPVYQGTGAISATISNRLKPSDPIAYVGLKAVNSAGVIPYRACGRYLSAGFIFSGDISHFQGFDFEAPRMGRR